MMTTGEEELKSAFSGERIATVLPEQSQCVGAGHLVADAGEAGQIILMHFRAEGCAAVA